MASKISIIWINNKQSLIYSINIALIFIIKEEFEIDDAEDIIFCCVCLS
jgi:hypothetical protein